MSTDNKDENEDEIVKIDPLDKMTNDQIVAQFYRKILAWDVSSLKSNEKQLKQVKVEFKDRYDYINTFEPLLLEECRAQLERAIEEGGEKNDENNDPVLSRVRYISENDDFLDVGLVMTKETDVFQFHENDLMMISLHHPMILFGGDENEEMTDDEATTVTHTNGASTPVAGEDPDKVFTLEKKKKKVIPPSKIEVTEANRYLHLVGTVEQFEMGGIKVRFCLTNIPGERGRQMNLLLRYEMNWWTSKLCNCSTLQREYLALYATAKTSFMKTLLLADEDEPGLPMKIPPALKEKFESSFNTSQYGALTSALDGSNITLIQGPPGTGKTHVIVGLLSVLLHSTEVPKHVVEEKETYEHRELFDAEKMESWDISQPWLNKGYSNVRDNYTLIDYTFEEKEEKRKRDLWRKLRETGTTKNIGKKKRILLCAPSNGAVDEIVTRLIRDGLLNNEGKSYRPNLVRVGPGSHQDVEPVTLEYMVRCRQQLMNSNTAIPSSSASTAVATTASKSNMDTNSIRTLVLEDAEIIATTLSFSGSSLLTKMNGFDIVIIDEAAQAVETSTLVPMQHKCKKIVLVGDPKQLPATIISPLAVKQKYDQSLFQRLQEKKTPHMLTTQYRMHSKIRAFPSKHFYNDLLEDGPNIPSRATNYHSNPFFGPLIFYDLPFSVETKPGGGSVFNEDECRMALQLYQLLLKTYPDESFSGRIGIISPYRQQVLSLREYFKNYSGVSIDTVDGFQGREREIIIFSCVRAPAEKGSGIGFLADVRRMNVALTRPRSSLLIIGNSKSLCINPDWYQLIKHAQENNNLIPITNSSLETIVPTLTNPELYKELSQKGSEIILHEPTDNPDEVKKKDTKRKKTQRKKKENTVDKEKEKEKKTKKQRSTNATATIDVAS